MTFVRKGEKAYSDELSNLRDFPTHVTDIAGLWLHK